MRRILFRFLTSCGLLATFWLAGFGCFLLQVPTASTEEARVTDAVVVLTGGKGRIDLGLKRMKEGKARQIFISGVNDEATAEHIIHEAIVREAPDIMRSDSEQLALGYQATSTIGNADEVKKWVEAHHIASIRLVTANYHMPRSLLEFKQVMPASLMIVPDPVFPEGFSMAEWWRMGHSTHLLLSEYHKMIAAYLRHALIAWHKG